MPRAEGILIAGGYGEVGKQIAGDLAPDYPGRVIVGGRDESQALALAEALGNGTRALRLDIDDPASVGAALRGMSLVINCIDQREPHLLHATIARSLAYTDITAHLTFWRTALALDAEARQSGARILLGAGLLPGITNVLARAGAERVGWGEERADVGAAESGRFVRAGGARLHAGHRC